VEVAVSEKILFVDDETSALDGFRRILHGSFDVRTAGSGGEGLVAVDRDGPFAVVVSDMRMPGMDGAEFLARVRQKAPRTVRMLLTGHADLHSAIDAVNRGQILHFLTKPCPKNVLAAALNSGVDQYKAAIEEDQLAGQARLMQRTPIDWSAASSPQWEQFRSPLKLPGPAQARSLLEPLIGTDTHVYTVLVRMPVLETVEQRYGESGAMSYLSSVTGFLQNSLSPGDRLFHWSRDIVLAVLRRYISPSAVRMEMERMMANTRGSVIEVQGLTTMVACLLTFDLLPAAQFSGFPEWLASFQAHCRQGAAPEHSEDAC
jgi:FixJ family two-component response regulator